MGERDERNTTHDRGRAESAADKANNPGPPPSERPDPGGASAQGINPVLHSERAAGGDEGGDAERTGEGTGSRAGEYS